MVQGVAKIAFNKKQQFLKKLQIPPVWLILCFLAGEAFSSS
jgi:hypothetical protein